MNLEKEKRLLEEENKKLKEEKKILDEENQKFREEKRILEERKYKKKLREEPGEKSTLEIEKKLESEKILEEERKKFKEDKKNREEKIKHLEFEKIKLEKVIRLLEQEIKSLKEELDKREKEEKRKREEKKLIYNLNLEVSDNKITEKYPYTITKENKENEEEKNNKRIANMTNNEKLNELNKRLLDNIFGKKSKNLTNNKKIHLFSRKINCCDTREKICLNISLKNHNKICIYQGEIYDNNNNLISKTKIKSYEEQVFLKKNLLLFFEFTKVEIITIVLTKYINKSVKLEETKKISLQEIILKNKNGVYEEPLNDFYDNELICIEFEVQKDEKFFELKFNADKNYKRNYNIFYTIQKEEKILFKSPLCKISNIKQSDKLKGDDLKPEFEISFYNDYFIEKKVKLRIDELEREVNKDIELPNINNIKINVNIEEIKNDTFLELLLKGLNIHLSIAIDFTGSNGEASSKSSLHYIQNGFVNNYEKAIREIVKIISIYNRLDIYDVYGFGASINGRFKKIFNLNLTDYPCIIGEENIISEYKKVVNNNNIVFSGGTFFAPIIKEIKRKLEINKISGYYYHILLIISDGIIDDIIGTIDSIIEASKYPTSFIIIGIGNDVTSDMRTLNGENGELISSQGEKLNRDIVQYVHFNDYAKDLSKLTGEVFKYIPDQISKFY